ncbi:MAG: hypothetical protein RLN72_07970 [Henriciella sp.]
MILQGNQRGGAKELALHLLKDENEHVELHELRGFASHDLVGALNESYAISRGTRAKQFLFSLSLNPPPKERVPVETFEAAISKVEERLGLQGQPRAIVFHEKEGRRHAHAVWSRIDTDEMKAINLPFYKTRLREVSKEIYLENGWQMPRGFVDSEARDPRNFTLEEWQQARRAGWNARDLKGLMQECWAASDSKAAFEHALRERGITLAKGDRRGHVAITHDGEVLSVARYTDKKAKEVRAKLGEPDHLPSVDDAQAQIARDMSNAAMRHIREARDLHRREMEPLEARRQTITQQHTDERRQHDAAQQARWLEEARARSDRLRGGVRGLWDRLTGERARIIRQNEHEALQAFQRDRDQRQALIDAQLDERQRLQSEIEAARQWQAQLLTELRSERERYRQISPEPHPIPPVRQEFQQASEKPPERTAPLAQEHFERVAKLREPSPPSQSPEARQTNEAQRDMADRLEQLRNNTHQPQRSGPEQERS